MTTRARRRHDAVEEGDLDRSFASIGRVAVSWLTMLVVLLLMFVSSMMLARFGIAYETPGGSPLEKFHPATYVSLLALVALFLARMSPVALVDEILRHHHGLVALFLAWIALVAHIVIAQGAPFSAVVDTFLLPMILLVLLTRLAAEDTRRLAWMLHGFMAANALLGLAEFGFGIRLTPVVANGMVLVEWRSSAFLGHPLANAAATGVYMVIMMIGGGRDLPGPLRAAIFAIQWPAMAVFGGRAALVLVVAFTFVLAFRSTANVVTGRRFSLLTAAALGALVPIVVALVIGLAAQGFFDRFILRFFEDDGSAETRISMFILIGQIPFRDLVFGPDPEVVATLQRLEGVEFGIESFWVAFIAYYGILISVPFFVGFLMFLNDLRRVTQPQAIWVLLFYLVTASTSASISGKTTSFAVIVVLILVLLRRRTDEPVFAKRGARVYRPESA
jgi:hypothetical protein